MGQRVWQRPGTRHLIAALDRYNDRLGTQFAGSMTYFSFVALVPILMVAFAVAGFVLASKADLLTTLRTDIAQQLPAGLSSTVTGILDAAVTARLTVDILGLVIALYSARPGASITPQRRLLVRRNNPGPRALPEFGR